MIRAYVELNRALPTMTYLMNILLLLSAAIFGVFLLFSIFYTFISFNSPTDNRVYQQHWLATLSEMTFTLAAPITGFLRANHIDEQEFPFGEAHLPTLIVLSFVAIIAYWISRLFVDKLPPLLSVLVLIALVQGWLINFTLLLHFGGYLVLGALFPIVGYELTAPLLNLIFLGREFYLNHLRFCEKYPQYEGKSWLIRFLAQPYFMRKTSLIFVLFFPFFFVQQVILTLFGQAPDAILRVFIESCKFNFSDNRYCPPPPEHYLCTIAAQGNPKLVKPLRPGYRGGQIIWVNRQLMVANAFEDWLAEVAPSWQKKLRKVYDSLKIPVDNWCRYTVLANVFYCLMKPLEWSFLVWLYCVDTRPEQRIARQYLPKNYPKS